MEVTKG